MSATTALKLEKHLITLPWRDNRLYAQSLRCGTCQTPVFVSHVVLETRKCPVCGGGMEAALAKGL